MVHDVCREVALSGFLFCTPPLGLGVNVRTSLVMFVLGFLKVWSGHPYLLLIIFSIDSLDLLCSVPEVIFYSPSLCSVLARLESGCLSVWSFNIARIIYRRSRDCLLLCLAVRVTDIYYIKLQKSLSVCLPVCLSVPPPLFFSTRPSDRNQIWHTCSGRYGTHSELKKLTQPTPGVISRHM